MKRHHRWSTALLLLGLVVPSTIATRSMADEPAPAPAATEPAAPKAISPEDAAKRRPKRFAIIYNNGYSSDKLPTDPAKFEKLVELAKSAHFNTILCQYQPYRSEICKKHDVQIMVDLLIPENHIYKNVAEAEKLCRSLTDNPVIYGYHLWSDNIGNTFPGRTRDVGLVHDWDPNHTAYVGCSEMSRINRVDGMDLLGYYDFQWRRGGHWPHLARAMDVAQSKNAYFLRYSDAEPGMIGKGNPNRAGYEVATSVVFGMKGYMYHHGASQINVDKEELDPVGLDLQKVNAKIAPLGDELMAIGRPTGVYSTPISKTAKNDPIEGTPAVPGGLTPVPDGHWFKIAQGEVLVGEYADASKRSVLVFACHNPYESQQVTLELPKERKSVEVFDLADRKWKPLPVADGKATFGVEDYGVQLVRIAP